MLKSEFTQFAALLDGAYDLLGSGANKVINGAAKNLFFSAMMDYSLEDVRMALSAHCKDAKAGKFPPKPADLIDQIEKSIKADGRPGAEEAWATALGAQSELNTVVWTSETAEAFSICQPVLAASGSISARKTFLEAYLRLVAAARLEYLPTQWLVSLGQDVTHREIALKQAQRAGRLTATRVAGLLPAPRLDAKIDASGQAQLAKIRRMMATRKRRMDLVRELQGQRAQRITQQQKAKAQTQFEWGISKYGDLE